MATKRVLGFVSILIGAFLSSISFYRVREFILGGPAVDISLETNWNLFTIGVVLVIIGIAMVVSFFKK